MVRPSLVPFPAPIDVSLLGCPEAMYGLNQSSCSVMAVIKTALSAAVSLLAAQVYELEFQYSSAPTWPLD